MEQTNSPIFTLISREHLSDVLKNLQEFTGLSIRLIDGKGSPVLSFGDTCEYCSHLQKNIFSQEKCLGLYLKAGRRSQTIGEAYVFSCHGNLNNIAFPLINGNELIGTVILGPFLMDTADSTLVSSFAENHSVSPVLALELYDDLCKLKVIDPPQVNRLRKLLEHLLSSLLPGEKAFLALHQRKLYQQSRINESVQLLKEQGVPSNLRFQYEKEKELLTEVKRGNVIEAKRVLNELIGHALFSERDALKSARTRAVELVTLLSRVAMDGGADPENIYNLCESYIVKINNEKNFDNICIILQEVVESFMRAAFFEKDKGNVYIRNALRYISDNYNEHIDLARVAEYVGLSQSYFSALFNEVVGTSFKDYLNQVRVEESKHLLLSNQYELADIAITMGFPDQSYYCKVFKKMTGMTPGKYRKIVK